MAMTTPIVASGTASSLWIRNYAGLPSVIIRDHPSLTLRESRYLRKMNLMKKRRNESYEAILRSLGRSSYGQHMIWSHTPLLSIVSANQSLMDWHVSK